MKKRELKGLALSVFTAALLLTGCGSSGAATGGTKAMSNGMMEAAAPMEAPDYATDDVYYGEESAQMESAERALDADEAGEQAESAQNTNRKLIRTVSLDVETQEYESLIARIKDRVKALNGYVEESNEYNGSTYYSGQSRNAYMTLRIPADRLDDFLSEVAEESNITRQSENVTDVTLSYVDMESHRNVLRAEEERLTEMLADTETIEEMIYIESRLSEVRYQIESMESQLRTYDNKVDYATVTINVTEVEVLTPVEPEQEPTTWQRLSGGFMESLVNVGTGIRDFVVGVIIALPYLVVWGLIIFVIVLIIRKIIKSRNAKKQKKQEALMKQREEQQRQWEEYQAKMRAVQNPQNAPAAPAKEAEVQTGAGQNTEPSGEDKKA